MITSSVVLYGCETWSLKSREEHKLRVFKNRVLRRVFGPKRDEVTGELRRVHNEEFYALYLSTNILVIRSGRTGVWGMGHVWETGEVHTGFWWGDVRERGHLEDLGLNGDNIEIDL
jgi:hypothetical protein